MVVRSTGHHIGTGKTVGASVRARCVQGGAPEC